MKTTYPYYCLKCNTFKRAIKRCIRGHHSIAIYQDDFHYDESIDEHRKDIWKSRYTEEHDDENIKKFDYHDIEPTDLCPVHHQRALGFCFSCNRSFCLENTSHFGHEYVLFSDLNPSFENVLTDSLEKEEIQMQYAYMHDFVYRQDQIKTLNFSIKRQALQTLGLKLAEVNSISHDIISNHIVKCINIINSWTDEAFNQDTDEANELLEQVEGKISDLFISEALQSIKKLRSSDEIPKIMRSIAKKGGCIRWNRLDRYSDQYRLKPYDFCFPLVIETEDSNEDFNKNERWKTINVYLNVPYGIKRLYQLDDNLWWEHIYLKDNSNHSKYLVQHTFKNEDLIDKGSPDHIVFIDTNNDLIQVNINANSVEESTESVIPCPYEFKRLLKTYRTNIKAIGQTETNEIYYLDQANEWHELKFPNFNELAIGYIGGKYSDDIYRGVLITYRYIHWYGRLSQAINCYDIGFIDDKIILVWNGDRSELRYFPF